MTMKVYATAIQDAIARGELAEMRKVAKIAEEHLRDYGNVQMAYEVLKVEIARLELRHKQAK